ncbi:MAG: hypothetical protein EPN77_19790 [Candidimonas sp.]|nr:MAG: hypothetical protein EPN77_19790 [Candidimonas sp.]
MPTNVRHRHATVQLCSVDGRHEAPRAGIEDFDEQTGAGLPWLSWQLLVRHAVPHFSPNRPRGVRVARLSGCQPRARRPIHLRPTAAPTTSAVIPDLLHYADRISGGVSLALSPLR